MKLSIKGKLILYATGIFLLLTFLGIYITVSLNKLERFSSLKENVDKVSYNTLKLRSVEKNHLITDQTSLEYFETGQSRSLDEFKRYYQSTDSLIKMLKKDQTIHSFGLEGEIKEVESSLKNYQRVFGSLVEARYSRGFKDFGLIGGMRENVHYLEDELPSMWMQVKVLSLRRHEKDYLLRKDLKYRDRLDKVVTEIRSVISDPILVRNVENYQKSFHRITEMDIKIGLSDSTGIQGELNQIVAKVAPQVNAINNTIEQRIDEAQGQTIFSIILVILIITAVSSFFAIVMIRTINRSVKSARGSIKMISEGHLPPHLATRRQDEMGDLLRSLNHMIQNLRHTIFTIKESSNNLGVAGGELNKSSQLMSEGASNQASSLEEISASMEEMVANIEQNTTNARQTNELTQKGYEALEASRQKADEASSAMKTITGKISIISEIARQTNLLALNAAVEAARAGEYGKGFSVVASEIRRLAERSQVAASEIDEVSVKGVEIAEESANILTDTVHKIEQVTHLIQEITNSSSEQSSGSNQINSAVQNLNQVVQQNASLAEEIAASANELTLHSGNMSESVNFFKLEEEIKESEIETDTVKEISSGNKTIQKSINKRQYKDRLYKAYA